MEDVRATHDSFVVERVYLRPPEQVFQWFSDADKKRRWFVENSREMTLSYECDFRVGGVEQTRWEWQGGGPIPAGTIMGNDTVYMDIVPNRRIVIAYSMLMGDRRFSSSLLTFDFLAEKSGTRLKATEQGAFFEQSDGAEMRKNGWGGLLESLAEAIDADS